ncbi:hypothetical protein LJB82_01470 [Desulfovibrio sp. OttesenSCG-928-M16]|nr:hypothetical protein [Desulfovibrio sp. OttesenSCG-928-M16]
MRRENFEFNNTVSPTPFDWPKVKVPTPEDLGLEWWPTEPGYKPENASK